MLPSTQRPGRHPADPTRDVARPGARVPKGPSATADAAVSSAAVGGPAEPSMIRATPPGLGAHETHGLVAVGPGFPGSMLVAGYAMNPLPVQPAKIHCPPERSDTLSRERLNSWLERASAGRLGLIVAEAGFGKTTLLGDWARHTRRMTAWYRLESDDRDWLTFIRHLVAAGRELDPGFAPATFEMLVALGGGGPTPHDLTISIAREMAELGAGSDRGLTLIIDDYHLVDGFHETEPIVRALLDRTGPGFSLVIASRSMPTLPLGRLRSRGGVMTLAGHELCFDPTETSTLFRDAYLHPLDDDVASGLHERTEGWPALLNLARTRMEEHPDARAFLSRLGATRGDLYDFLAEEVIDALDPEMQAFLTRVSVLTAVDAPRAQLVDDRPLEVLAALIAQAERIGLLARPDDGSPHRFHPLVREFLASRLGDEIGEGAVLQLHHSIASALESTDWRAAAWHSRAAGDPAGAARIVDNSISSILAAGRFGDVRELLDGTAGSTDRPGALILRSRLELERGQQQRAIELAEAATRTAEAGDLAGLAMLNLTAMHAQQGFDVRSVELASQALSSKLPPAERLVAEATVVVSATQDEGHLPTAADYLAGLARLQDEAGHLRYAGVTRLNLAIILLWMGDPTRAAATAAQAECVLPSGSPERVAATAVRVASAVQQGQVGALSALDSLIEHALTITARDDAAMEAARLHADYGSLDRATDVLARVSADASGSGYAGSWRVIGGTLALRRGDADSANALLGQSDDFPLHDAVGRFRTQLLRTRIALARGDAASELAELERLAHLQGSTLCLGLAQLLRSMVADQLDGAVARLMPDQHHLLSVLADEVCRYLPRLGTQSGALIRAEATLRPDRWVSALRPVFAAVPQAAELLSNIGGPEDGAALRAAAATKKWLRPAASRITRRLAPPVLVADLGSVRVLIGGAPPERAMRRKVLALLCYLSTRPGMAATRDEALDAIWPDLGPDTAVNSLHQTIYFLRRIFEAQYREGMSAGYVGFDGDIVSLDRDLVDTVSSRCWRLIKSARGGSRTALVELSETYSGTYALDFAYEDWASSYRDNLHAAVLEVTEAGIRGATDSGEIEIAIDIARRVLEVDPHADAIELQLLRAYKRGGLQAAAAEQYAHYASYIRGELGAEPASFREI